MPEDLETLRAFALGLPEAVAGIACAGTALERRTVAVRKKVFLFLGAGEAMVKLGASLEAAVERAAREPGRCKVGKNGWVKVRIGEDVSGEEGDGEWLRRWVDESYRLMAPRGLVVGGGRVRSAMDRLTLRIARS